MKKTFQLLALRRGGLIMEVGQNVEGRADKLPIQEKEQVNERQAQRKAGFPGRNRARAARRRCVAGFCKAGPPGALGQAKAPDRGGGEFLYNAGFWGEYTALRACRRCAPAQKTWAHGFFRYLKDPEAIWAARCSRLARAHRALYPLLERNQKYQCPDPAGKAADRPGPRPEGRGCCILAGGAAVFPLLRVGGVCDPGIARWRCSCTR